MNKKSTDLGNVFKISKVTKRVSISTKETKNLKTVKYGAVTALKDHMLKGNKVSQLVPLYPWRHCKM